MLMLAAALAADGTWLPVPLLALCPAALATSCAGTVGGTLLLAANAAMLAESVSGGVPWLPAVVTALPAVLTARSALGVESRGIFAMQPVLGVSCVRGFFEAPASSVAGGGRLSLLGVRFIRAKKALTAS